MQHFLADLKITSVGWKNAFLASYSTSSKFMLVTRDILTTAEAASSCLLPETFWLEVLKNAYKAGTVNFANSLSCHHLPLWRKYTLEVKTAKGLKRCQVTVKGVNNPAWTTQQMCNIYLNIPPKWSMQTKICANILHFQANLHLWFASSLRCQLNEEAKQTCEYAWKFQALRKVPENDAQSRVWLQPLQTSKAKWG